MVPVPLLIRVPPETWRLDASKVPPALTVVVPGPWRLVELRSAVTVRLPGPDT